MARSSLKHSFSQRNAATQDALFISSLFLSNVNRDTYYVVSHRISVVIPEAIAISYIIYTQYEQQLCFQKYLSVMAAYLLKCSISLSTTL